MIALGLRLRDLGSESFTWSDLRAIVKHLPQDAALRRSTHPEESRWGVSEYLLAVIADSLRWLVWAKTKDAKRNRNKPKPIPRPGEKRKGKGRFKDAVALTLDEVKRRLALPRR